MTTPAQSLVGNPAHVLMIRPAAFSANAQTAASNRFQCFAAENIDLQPDAAREFSALAENLDRHGIKVSIFEGNTDRALPDEIFANNWISTHPDGLVLTYPMMAANRRAERRADVLQTLQSPAQFADTHHTDFSAFEATSEFLEGTGSLVIDHVSKVGWCALSPRSTPGALQAVTHHLGLQCLAFPTRDSNGHAIYHTNVLLSLGRDFAVACLEVIPEPNRTIIRDSLELTNRRLLEISESQMRSFCGNLIYLDGTQGPAIFMSTTAHEAFQSEQLHLLAQYGTVVPNRISTIERFGGGSVRCMITEILLPRAAEDISRSG